MSCNFNSELLSIDKTGVLRLTTIGYVCLLLFLSNFEFILI